jgi:hypothetical protein
MSDIVISRNEALDDNKHALKRNETDFVVKTKLFDKFCQIFLFVFRHRFKIEDLLIKNTTKLS